MFRFQPRKRWEIEPRAHHTAFYTEYINSDEWAKRRTKFYDGHKRVCRACKSNKKIHLHHHTYDRLGRELDADLVPLCEGCHEEVHLYHNQRKNGQTLSDSTFEWVAQRKAERLAKLKAPKVKKKVSKPPKAPPKRGRDPVNDALHRIRERRK